MNVLITGASGFFGGHCVEAFTHRGDKVTAVVRPSSRCDLLKSLNAKLHVATLDQVDELRRAMRDIDVVIHAAARVETYGHWRDFEQTTINGTRNVLETAIAGGVRHFIHVSSRGIYERPARDGTLYEETCAYGVPYRWSYYARAKIEAEKIVREANDQRRIAATILRPTWLYGPRDTTIFGRVVTALRARRFRWIGDGQNVLNLVFVSDAANAVVLAATDSKARGQVYNIADDENSVTQRHFLTGICEQLDLPMPRASLPYGRAHRLGFLGECIAHATGFRVRPPISRLSVLLLGGRRRFSNQKLRNELGWKPATSFKEGLQKTIEWFRTVPS
jgi:nucleoside-diphosphate-sugar epimerase